MILSINLNETNRLVIELNTRSKIKFNEIALKAIRASYNTARLKAVVHGTNTTISFKELLEARRKALVIESLRSSHKDTKAYTQAIGALEQLIVACKEVNVLTGKRVA